MSIKQETIEKLKKYNQEKIIKIFEKLEEGKQEELSKQILDMNFDQIKNLYESTKYNENKIVGKIEPIQAIDKSKLEKKEFERLDNIGKEVIKNGEYAVVTMAGGQGTRLGFNGPKGTFKLDIGQNGKYIFEILSDTLKKGAQKTGVKINWYIMTSEENDEDTKSFFEEHKYFEYDKEKIKFFKQSKLPLISKEGNLLMGKDFKLREASDGNGGVYKALKNSGMIDDMKKNNIKWVLICGVDNIMANMVDTVFIGYTIDKKVQVASKSIAKSYPEEKVGVFCKRDGKPSIIEYIELSEDMRYAKNENGDLIYGDANIVSHLLSTDAMEKIAAENLDYHVAVKKNAYVDENLKKINPEEANSYKFEAFIFDGFKFLDDMAIFRVKREEEFAPIKNKEGADSPETAKRIYMERNFIGQ